MSDDPQQSSASEQRRRVVVAIGLSLVLVVCLAALVFQNRDASPDEDYEASTQEYTLSELEHTHGDSHDWSDDEVHERIAELDAELERNPGNLKALADKVHIGLEHDPALAIETCQTILKGDPNNLFALDHLAIVYMSQGEFERALHYASRARELEPSAYFEALIAQIYLREGKLKQAIDRYHKALAIEPDYAPAIAGLKQIENAAIHGQWAKPADRP